MSAIFGIIDFEGRPIDPEWIKSMQSDLAHRGPDGYSLYQEESMFMGHMLLQVTPESIYDTSPYEEEGFVITANARLDEREALMDRLNIPPSEQIVITDPLLLLRSFRKFGKDFVKDIYGDFAFAIWDKEKKELFCARDQIGVKPFLYYFEDNRFVFSTELKTIIKLPFVKTELDDIIMRDDCFDIDYEAQISNWKNVYRLPRANHLVISSNNSGLYLYWTLQYQKNDLFSDVESSAKALKQAGLIAVEDRMKTNYNVGVPLSGGLDSGSIACIAAQYSKKSEKNIYSFSSMLDPKLKSEENKDETEYIRAVIAQEKNIIPGFFYSSQLSFYKNLMSRFDRYYLICSPYNYVDETLYENFERVKVRRLLSGYVGDITVSNRSILPLAHLFLAGKFISMFQLGKQIKKQMNLSFFQLIKVHLIGPLSPYFIKNIWHLIRGNKPNWKIDVPIFLRPDEKVEFNKKRKEYYRKQLNYNFKIEEHILPHNYEVFREDFDTGSSHYQLEMTHPLMDRRVLECLMKIPVEYFYADGFYRGLIKKAMKDILPDEIRNRTDKGYYAPGFYQVISKDISQLINHIEVGATIYHDLNKTFEINKIVHYLKKDMICKKKIFFSEKDWNYLYVCNWIIYEIWVRKHNLTKNKSGK
jgi:asparagine synthase (glutamine-hydrolysing)